MDNEEIIDRGKAIQSLQRNQGWQYFMDHIEDEEKALRNSLIAGGFSNIEDYNLVQQKHQFVKELLELPEKWIDKKNKLEG